MIIPEHLDNPKLVLITGGVGLFVNIIGLFLFHQHGHSHSHGGHGHSHGGHDHNNHSGNSKTDNVPVVENSKEIEIVDKTTSLPLLQQNDYEIEPHVETSDAEGKFN